MSLLYHKNQQKSRNSYKLIIERKGYKVNDSYFDDKNKKRLTNQITFAESVYHPSENEYISLSDEYLIITEF